MKSKKSETPTVPPARIGRYEVRRSLGRGGMGEVLLCWDPEFGREVAVKRIREELQEQPRIRHRFLREARIAGRLNHPGIIAVYELCEGEPFPYYVMPYVSGRTLREILSDPTAEVPPISTLLRTYLQICQAVAYSHSREILHRDLKPENVIVGHFGEVVLLDWGLAKAKDEVEEPLPTLEEAHQTVAGRIVGTLAYMAPERTLRQPATVSTEVYALGVMLYQMLCLRLPFKRKTFKDFRKSVHRERFEDPSRVAPQREVPSQLVRIAKRCMHPIPARRYANVEALIHDISRVLEGRSDWFPVAELSIHNRADWEFQEHILLPTLSPLHLSLTGDWVGLMISKASFSGNVRIETLVRLRPGCAGIGFLLSVPEASERLYPDDGYLLWMGSQEQPGFTLHRRHALVLEHNELSLPQEEWHRLEIEQIDNAIRCTLNHQLVLSYVSHLPLHGTHIGVLHRDANFETTEIKVATGNDSVTVSCLALPDAFLSHGEYGRALSEYRRLAYSFPERAEGRDAIFRAGLTLLEQAKRASHPGQKEALWQQSTMEFERLHGGPSAPLEYLGKSLLAQGAGQTQDEVQYLEFSLRRYPDHPLRGIIEEQIWHRLSESARECPATAALFLSLVFRLLPQWRTRTQITAILQLLEQEFELPVVLRQAPPDLQLDYALVATERLERSTPPSPGLLAAALLGQQFPAEELPPQSEETRSLVEQQLFMGTMPSAAEWATSWAAAGHPQSWLSLLLRRAEDLSWDLRSWGWDLWSALCPALQDEIHDSLLRQSLLMNDASWWQALQELSGTLTSPLNEFLAACFLCRQQGMQAALQLLEQVPIQGDRVARAPQLAIRTALGRPHPQAWLRALPVEQREACRLLCLWYHNAQQPHAVHVLRDLLSRHDWRQPPIAHFPGEVIQ